LRTVRTPCPGMLFRHGKSSNRQSISLAEKGQHQIH
jgi:hypothetical protein